MNNQEAFIPDIKVVYTKESKAKQGLPILLGYQQAVKV